MVHPRRTFLKPCARDTSCWSSEQCPMCHKTVYDEENIQDLIILCCCGNRSHLSCFQERFAQYKQIPGCTSLTCIQTTSPFANQFVYIGQNFECVACFLGGSSDDLSQFIVESKKDVDDIDKRVKSKELWKKWPYLENRNLSYEECQQSGSKRPMDNTLASPFGRQPRRGS